MTRTILFFLVAAVGMGLLTRNASAGAIIEADCADQMVMESGLNEGYYDTLYDIMAGRLHQQDYGTAIEPIPLPYLAPGQQVTGATVSFFLESVNGAPPFNLQLYGMTRVNATNSTPIPADYYEGTNDTANTLLDPTFVTPQSAVNSTITYSGSNLTSFIQKQYANTAFTSLPFSQTRFIFFRLSPDGTDANYDNYVFGSARNPIRTYHPTVSFTISNGIANVAGRLQFSFNLPQASVTSAGVYNPSTGALIRTLWSNVQYQAGLNYGAWDGTTDSGATAPTGTSYQIKLIYHNVQYVWNGMVGNTSTAQSGPNVYRSNENIEDMSIAGGNAYYAVGYDENMNPFNMFTVGSPQVPQQFVPNSADPYSSFGFVAADATHDYWAKCAGGLSGTADTFIVAFNNSGGTPYTFTSGTTPTGSAYYTSCCDFDATANQPNPATGLAVQQSGSDLFVSHSNLNVVRVFDKLKGTSLGTFAVTSPSRMAVTADGDVWVVSNTSSPSVTRYTFASGKATVKATISGLVAPRGIGVSADDSTILVADGGTSQQIKAFNNTTGASLWTYGVAGGMQVNGPNVVNNVFDFGTQSFVSFQSDNSFWVGDPGNLRYLHFSYSGSTLTYIEQIAYVPISYDAAADPNVPTRVINQFLEHTVNYSLPLGGTNGSWTLVKNWIYGLPNDATHLYTGFQNGVNSVVTLSNGHTYALMNNFITSEYDLFELPATGFARPTGYSFYYSPRLYEDGTLRFSTNTGTAMSYYSMPLTGFDSSNNPEWGSPSLLATAPISSTSPQSWIGTFPERTEVTSSGMVVDFDPNEHDTGYHLGGIPKGGTAFQWLSCPSTTGTYTGWFPQNGAFDIGNGVQYAGNVAMAMGANIVYGYHGEFWKSGEASQWINYLDNGLMVGRFGTYGNVSSAGQTTVNGYCGNSYSPSLVTVNGNVYLYCNDESVHGGTARWEIEGWNGIATVMGTSTVGSTASLSSSSSGPQVTITSPTAGGNYYNGRSIVLSAAASSSSGVAITSVQFFDGSNSLGTVTSSPFTLNYSGLSTGSHVITANATDANGLMATSAAVNITVGADGTSTPPPAPASLVATAVGSSSVTLGWSQPTTSTTSATTGQILSFQFAFAGNSNALTPTMVAGAPGYAVDNFNLLQSTGTGNGTTGTALIGMVFINPVNNSGVTVPNLGMNLQTVFNQDDNSLSKSTGTALDLFGSEASTQYNTAVGISIYDVPYGVYDLVVYSQPANISSGTQTSSITVSNNEYSTTVNQTFNTMPTGYSASSIAFGSSTSVTNSNTIVIQGLTSSSFILNGNNIAAFQIVQRPYNQGIPSSYSIERAVGTSGTFVPIATVAGTVLSYTDSTASPGTTYEYCVQAVNSYGSSPLSNTVTVTTSGTSTGSTSSGSTSSGSTSSGSTSSGSTSSGSTSSGSTSSGSTSSGSTSSGSTSSGSTSSGSTSSGSTSSGSTSSGSTSSGSTSSGSTSSTQTGFQKWQAEYFTTAQLADASISGPSADPYGSGVPNLLAYALQLNPATARPTDVPHAMINNGHLTMTYFSVSADTDITYTVQVSTDLNTWNSGTGYTQVISTVPSSAGNTITVQDELPSTSKHFMRLQVTQNN